MTPAAARNARSVLVDLVVEHADHRNGLVRGSDVEIARDRLGIARTTWLRHTEVLAAAGVLERVAIARNIDTPGAWRITCLDWLGGVDSAPAPGPPSSTTRTSPDSPVAPPVAPPVAQRDRHRSPTSGDTAQDVKTSRPSPLPPHQQPGPAPARAVEGGKDGFARGIPDHQRDEPGAKPASPTLDELGPADDIVDVLGQLADRVEATLGTDKATSLRTPRARDELGHHLAGLVTTGAWTADELVDELTARELATAENVAAVIAGRRIPQLPEFGPSARRREGRRRNAANFGRSRADADGYSEHEFAAEAAREYAADHETLNVALAAFAQRRRELAGAQQEPAA